MIAKLLTLLTNWGALIGFCAFLLLFGGVIWWRIKKTKRDKALRAARMRVRVSKKSGRPPEFGTLRSTAEGIPEEAPEFRSVILIVDDSQSALFNAKKILEKQPYRLIFAENGQQAWGLIQDQIPDLVISDIDMPVMNGFQLLKLMREDYRLGSTPFMMMTSNIQAHLKEGSTAQFDSLLCKPYKPEDLIDQVRFLLQE